MHYPASNLRLSGCHQQASGRLASTSLLSDLGVLGPSVTYWSVELCGRTLRRKKANRIQLTEDLGPCPFGNARLGNPKPSWPFLHALRQLQTSLRRRFGPHGCLCLFPKAGPLACRSTHQEAEDLESNWLGPKWWRARLGAQGPRSKGWGRAQGPETGARGQGPKTGARGSGPRARGRG